MVHLSVDIEVGAASGLSEPQAFKIFSLLMMIDQIISFYQILFKTLYHIQVFDV